MRVIAGTYRSRQLKSLKGLALRPTSDRLRETLFNVISGRIAGSFLDPPYAAMEDYRRVLSFLGASPLLAEGGLVIAEHRRSFELPESAGNLQSFRVLRQGDASLTFYRFACSTPSNDASGE